MTRNPRTKELTNELASPTAGLISLQRGSFEQRKTGGAAGTPTKAGGPHSTWNASMRNRELANKDGHRPSDFRICKCGGQAVMIALLSDPYLYIHDIHTSTCETSLRPGQSSRKPTRLAAVRPLLFWARECLECSGDDDGCWMNMTPPRDALLACRCQLAVLTEPSFNHLPHSLW
ncbi:hypothetical protein L209DRAFT_357188 [Thermothelomyces heterothallicus CBS 203.75]